MSGGYVLLWRKMYDAGHWLHPTQRDPSCRRDAWCYLFQLAVWKESETPNSGTLKRGEFVTSLRSLGKEFRWSKDRVKRFMSDLEVRTAIETVRETPDGTVYRIVNYDTYATTENTQRDTQRDSERDRGETEARQEEVSKKLKTTSTPLSSEGRKRPTYPPEFEAVWEVHRRGPKAKALLEWKRAVPSLIAQDDLVRCLTEYRRREVDGNDRFNGHDLFRWLRDERWEEYRNGNGRSKSAYRNLVLDPPE